MNWVQQDEGKTGPFVAQPEWEAAGLFFSFTLSMACDWLHVGSDPVKQPAEFLI